MTQETRAEWHARGVIDACLRYAPSATRRSSPSLTYLRAAPPIDTQFSLLRWVTGEGMVKQYNMPWHLLLLFQFNLGEMLACGATKAGTARAPEDGGEREWVWADERVTVGPANVVISDRSLRELAAQIAAGSVLPAAPATPKASGNPGAVSTDWKVNGRTIGEQLAKEKDCSVEELAEAVRQEMTVRHQRGEPGMTKRGGKLIPCADSIKRWALNGIKT